MLLIFCMWFVPSFSQTNKVLSAREYKEEVGTCATQALKSATACMQACLLKPFQSSDTSFFSDVTQFQLFCIEQVENLLDDNSFWHKSRRSTIVSEAPIIIDAYKKVISSCTVQEKKIEHIADVCKQAVDQIMSATKKIKASV